MSATKFKNISDGPRGIYTTNGLVMVERGAEIEAELAKGEEPNEEWFAKAGSAAAKAADKAEADAAEAPAKPAKPE